MKALSLFPLALAALVACEEKKSSAPSSPTAVAPANAGAAKEANEIFNTRCSMCHGAAGKGDGAAAQAINPKPRDMTDAAWQKSVTDEHIGKIILEGGQAVGKSPLMPPNPDLKDKAAVVTELVKKVRSLAH